MKCVFLVVFAIILIPAFAIAQTASDTILPEPVVKTFKAKYGGKSMEEWIKEGDQYIITYFSDNQWFDVSIDVKGKWISTNILIDYDLLPKPVISAFETSKWAEFDVLKISKIEVPVKKNTQVNYQFVLSDKQENEVKVTFSESGQVVP